VPWGFIVGYGKRDEVGATIFASFVDTEHFNPGQTGASLCTGIDLNLGLRRTTKLASEGVYKIKPLAYA